MGADQPIPIRDSGISRIKVRMYGCNLSTKPSQTARLANRGRPCTDMQTSASDQCKLIREVSRRSAVAEVFQLIGDVLAAVSASRSNGRWPRYLIIRAGRARSHAA